nr:MBL fold metallo-hydrolase [Neobacillus terrae]
MHAEHDTDRPIIAAIAGERRTLMLDGGNSALHAQQFKEYLVAQGVRLPDLVVLTHWHWDHSIGVHAWNIPIISHSETAKVLTDLKKIEWTVAALEFLSKDEIINDESMGHILKEYGDPSSIEIAVPDVLFQNNLLIELGGVTCEVLHVGGDHASDSCFVYVNEDSVLFLGDALAPSVYGGPRKYTSSGFLKLMSIMHQFNAEIFIESHGVPTERKQFLEEIGAWEKLAQLVENYQNNSDFILKELAGSSI